MGADRASVTVLLAEPISTRTVENLRENGQIVISCGIGFGFLDAADLTGSFIRANKRGRGCNTMELFKP